MHKEAIISDVKRQNRQRIAKYILEKKQTSRQELAKALGYSMPTVFANVNELIEQGFVCEAGEYGSTGGRKAKVLTINRNHPFCQLFQIHLPYIIFFEYQQVFPVVPASPAPSLPF